MAIYLGIKNDGTFTTSDGYILQDANGVPLLAMAVPDKWKIIINGVAYRVNLLSTPSVIKKTLLLSPGNCILKDSNGCILISKESE